jgi:putative peptidoglycan lipid II flippase
VAGGVAALTAVSRVTGFARVLVATAVLGRGALGDTYQTANSVPNVVFELFAAGTLQAVLVPAVVRALDERGDDASERLAGAVLGALLTLLTALAAIAIVAAPSLMRAAMTGEPDAAVRHAKAVLGTTFLWFFVPQVLLYAAGLVATAVLHAKGRFLAPAAAPIMSNLVVMAVYVTFHGLRHGAAPSLALSTLQKVVLAGGTTAAVIALTLVPVLALRRTGLRVRPRRWRGMGLARLARDGGWAGALVAATQLLLVAALASANGAHGAVVGYTYALSFLLLPYAVLAAPLATTVFPDLVRAHQAGDGARFAALVGRAARTTVLVLVPAAFALMTLSWPIVRVTVFGAARHDGLAPLAHALTAFAPGLVGYGLFQLLVRCSYARGDARSPTVIGVASVLVGVAVMIVLARSISRSERAVALAIGHGVTYTVAAILLGSRLRVRASPAVAGAEVGS